MDIPEKRSSRPSEPSVGVLDGWPWRRDWQEDLGCLTGDSPKGS